VLLHSIPKNTESEAQTGQNQVDNNATSLITFDFCCFSCGIANFVLALFILESEEQANGALDGMEIK